MPTPSRLSAALAQLLLADASLSGSAYLHVDLWSIWWNDRTRCGAERTFLEICQKWAEPDCSLLQQAATQSPWVSSPPGAQLGCVYVEQSVTFEPGRHYLWRYGKISELSSSGPPQDIIDAFKRPEIGVDVSTRAACKLP